jgi:hypothetical protein
MTEAATRDEVALAIERLRNELTSAQSQSEDRILSRLTPTVKSAVQELLLGEFRSLTCPYHEASSKMSSDIQAVQKTVDGLQSSFTSLDKKLFNGEGAIPRFDARLRDVEIWRSQTAPFMPGPRSRGVMTGADHRDRKSDAIPTTWKAYLMSVPWFVWVLGLVNAVTLALVVAFAASPEEMRNLREIHDIIRRLPTPVPAAGPGG